MTALPNSFCDNLRDMRGLPTQRIQDIAFCGLEEKCPDAFWELMTDAQVRSRAATTHGLTAPDCFRLADDSGVRGIVKTCGLACYDDVARSVAGRGQSCRSDQKPLLMIRSVVGTQPVTNG